MRIGSLCSGYGGLDMGVQAVLGGTVAWHADLDPGAARILAHHWPEVPNLRDIKRIDWAAVEPVDVLTAGYPCQPFSTAGKRKGADDERHLWPYVREAVRGLRPRLTVLENVAGHRSMGFDRVLGDLAEDGLDARWVSVRASDTGAPHRRERLFIVAHPADADIPRWQGGGPAQQERRGGSAGGDHSALSLLPTPRTNSATGASSHGEGGPDLKSAISLPPTPVTEPATGNGHARNLSAEVLFPTPRASDGPNGGPGMRNGRGEADALPGVVALLPTPAVNDMGAGKTPEDWDAWTGRMREAHGNGNGHGPSLSIEALRLLPTPRAVTAPVSDRARALHSSGPTLYDVATTQDWGRYAAAIARWERVLGRPAPAPTEPTGKGGRHRLSPRFVEWLMGLPAGWVTSVPGLSYAAQLKALGNGVVPQQAALALRWLLAPVAGDA